MNHADTSQDFSTQDPLDEIDKIEVVQQSDTTVHYIQEEETAENDLSCISLVPPTQLLNVFENMNEIKSIGNAKGKKTSPKGVDIFEDEASAHRDEVSDEQAADRGFPSRQRGDTSFKLPRYDLDESLKINLPQPVIDRCSFYSVIHGVNKAVQDMALEDRDCGLEDTIDSVLVRAVNGTHLGHRGRDGPNVELAILDDEKFLLAIIDNREEEEMTIRACPATFAYAIGETEFHDIPYSGSSSSQTENPLTVVNTSRTQLWKPSRSWWEAKSGKNPWIEPKSHNKRWRYLWPLIHYHKFLAKCIKKLKRNNIDVKTSLNPVPAFLREEVCAVSDHLAAASKFTSDEWVQGLSKFQGWTDQGGDKQKRLQQLVKKIPMRSMTEPTDVDSPLLRNQIDKCFLKAMAAARDQMENGTLECKKNEERLHADYGSSKMKGRASFSSYASSSNSGNNRPPRNGGVRGSRSNRNNPRNGGGMNNQNRSQRGNNRMYNPYHEQSMMMQQQGYYQQPPHYPDPYNHGAYVPNHYMSQSMNNTICGWNNHYGGNDYSNMNVSMGSEWGQQYYGNPHFDHEASFQIKCDDSVANTSLASHNNFEGSQHSVQFVGQPPVPHQVLTSTSNTSFDEASQNGAEVTKTTMQTPSKNEANIGKVQNSPSWAHLHQVPGVTTPGTQHRNPMCGGNVPDATQFQQHQNWLNAKPLLINHTYQPFPHHAIPPSPATQFTMSPQANAQANAFFANGHPRPMSMNCVNHQVSDQVADEVLDDENSKAEETTAASTSSGTES